MLEGYHLHLRSVQGSTAKSSGPDFHDALTNSFDFQWNVKALRKAGLISAKSTHFDVDILDRLYDPTEALGIHYKVMPGYVRTKFGVPTMKYGSLYGMMAAANTVEAANNVPLTTVIREPMKSFWEKVLSTTPVLTEKKRKIHFTPDEWDVRLMIDNKQQPPDVLETTLLRNGLIMLKGSVSTFLEDLLKNERAYAILREMKQPSERQKLQQPKSQLNQG